MARWSLILARLCVSSTVIRTCRSSLRCSQLGFPRFISSCNKQTFDFSLLKDLTPLLFLAQMLDRPPAAHGSRSGRAASDMSLNSWNNHVWCLIWVSALSHLFLSFYPNHSWEDLSVNWYSAADSMTTTPINVRIIVEWVIIKWKHHTQTLLLFVLSTLFASLWKQVQVDFCFSFGNVSFTNRSCISCFSVSGHCNIFFFKVLQTNVIRGQSVSSGNLWQGFIFIFSSIKTKEWQCQSSTLAQTEISTPSLNGLSWNSIQTFVVRRG